VGQVKTHEVFGIAPEVKEHSYVDRGDLDATFRRLIERKQTHVAIRGVSKAGKSWLRQRVLRDPIVVQCRLSYTTAEIYRDALARLDIQTTVERTVSSTFEGKITAAGEAGMMFIAKASGELEASASRASSVTQQVIGKNIHDLDFIASIIKASGRMLVVEDFHYLPVEEQRKFAFDLKTLWDYQTFVVVVGVWISENMLITLNSDLSDRIEEIAVTWSKSELKRVLKKGCDALNLNMSAPVADRLAEISYESVGLLQKLALRLLDDELGITESRPGEPISIDKLTAVDDAGMHVADQLNQLYQAFAKRVADGIRTRNNSTGIYAHAMAAVMAADDKDLTDGLSARAIFAAASAKQPRIQLGNLKIALGRIPELQVDKDGRGLVLAYDPTGEKVSAVDKQLLLYRKFATVKWPWEDLIKEIPDQDDRYQV
jgi:hypothetical protein